MSIPHDLVHTEKCILNHGPRRVQLPTDVVSGKEIVLASSKTNKPLSEEETAESTRIVRGGTADLEELDEEISRVHNYLLDRMNERDRLQHYVKAHKVVLHPTRRLNHDLLHTIFMLTAEIDRESPDFTHSLDTHRAPWVLGQVCSSWRQIVKQNVPLMWSRVKLSIKLGPRSSSGYLMEHLLRRSAYHDLSVHLSFDPEYVTAQPGSWHPSLLRLFMACDRWKSLYLDISVHSYSSIEWSMLEGNLPKLRTLTLFLHPSGGFHPLDFIEPETSVYLAAPQLAAAKVIGWDSDLLPWRQLKKFSWSRYTLDGTELWHSALPEHLRLAVNLDECEFDCVFASSNPPASEEELVSLPKLHTLTLHSIVYPTDVGQSADQVSEPERLLEMFVMPVLTSLTLTGPIYQETALISCLEKSGCTLASLSIPYAGRPETRTIRILQHLPSLKCLTLTDADTMTSDFLDHLTYKEEGSTRAVACPALEEFGLCTSSTRRTSRPSLPTSKILDMITSRRPAQSEGSDIVQLQRLSISSAELAMSLRQDGTLAGLEKDGLIVQFIRPPRSTCSWKNSYELEQGLY